MENLIRRSDVLETYADLYDIFEDNKTIQEELHKVFDKLNDIPAVEPKQGEWIYHRPPDDWIMSLYSCSECGHIEEGKPKFCPNCGARM